jgi:hypothetical protein
MRPVLSMGPVFGDVVAEWTAFFAFTGGSAVTLLGLLFVAVPLRLDLFHQREVTDVRDFAAFAFVSLLGAMVVAGVALAPHAGRSTLAWPLATLGVGGVLVGTRLVREWARLNPNGGDGRHTSVRIRRQSLAVLVLTIVPFAGFIVVAGLVWHGSGSSLPTLAVVEGLLLASAAIASWALLSHAGSGSEG